MATSANAELIRTLFEDVWKTGDTRPLEGRGADEVVFHYRGSPTRTSLSALGQLIAHWRSAFPDLEFQVHQILGDGDFVAAHVTYTGTHQGDWFGSPATGRTVEVDEMMFFRFADGLLLEMWEVDDQLSMRSQLGLIT
jgi:steroid delta-isomerase-like uncharacterized protein